VYFPERGEGAAVMTNGDGGRALMDEILNAIAIEQGWPDSAPYPVAPVDVLPKRRARVVGTYEGRAPHATTVRAVVSRTGDRLFMDAPQLGVRTELVFTGPGELLSVETGDSFGIVDLKSGPASALVFGDMTMHRVKPAPGPVGWARATGAAGKGGSGGLSGVAGTGVAGTTGAGGTGIAPLYGVPAMVDGGSNKK
jgi:hypothetical protein